MKRKQILWCGTFNFSHEIIIMYTYAPTWAAARVRFLRRLAKEHEVSYSQVFSMFDGSKDNFKIEIEKA